MPSNRSQPLLRTRSWLLPLVGLVPVVAYAAYVGRWAFDTPLMDDFTLVHSVNRLADNGFADVGSILLEQLNDHRIVFSRAAALLVYGLRGYLDVRLLAWAGYANLLLLGWVLWRFFRTTGLPGAYFLPVPFLLFSPFLYQISLWGLVSFQPPLATAFSLASLYLLHRDRRWGWALPLAVMALFAGGNGVVVFASGGLLLVAERRYRRLVPWLVVCGAALGLYFYHYRFSSASQTPGGLLAWLGALVTNTAVFAGSYGSVFSGSKAVPVGLGLGSVVLVLSGLLFLRKIFPRAQFGLNRLFPAPTNWRLLAALLNMLGTAAMIALARSGGGAQEMTSDRFHLYASVLFVVFYLALVASLAPRHRRWLLRAALPLALLANAYAYVQFRPARDVLVESLAADAYNFPRHGVFLHQFPDFRDEPASEFRHCRFPVTFSEAAAQAVGQTARRGRPTVPAKTNVRALDRPIPYRGGLFPNLDVGLDLPDETPLPADAVWLFLASTERDGRVFFVAARRHKAPLTQYLRTGRFYANRFSTTIPRKVPAGRYRMGLCWLEGERAVAVCAPGTVAL